ncbi:MAG TPA: alkaline phosphatase family protein [Caldithrix abyssi]|uniref:Alkaline phosphatase family protein n=1 Tax=Caldithrix abyssi TaxID=187145 RepID=A0A7V4U3L7_CALAY|nr:alkaline phosphatase family protein [Caldithrix abyssi]
MKTFFRSLFIIIVFIAQLIATDQSEKRPYVILVSIDGFRWDYLDRDIAPNLQALAKEGVRALTLQPAFPSITFPNHYTIVTGLYPQNHGLIDNVFRNPFNNKRYSMYKNETVRDDYWYGGEALWVTARKNGVKSASYFWVGSETNLPYKHPDYFKYYDGSVSHKSRVDEIVRWMQLPAGQRPRLLFLYFSDVDTWGHRGGPDSPELNRAVAKVDSAIGYLRSRLAQIGKTDSVNIIVVSDHGMTSTRGKKMIALEELFDIDRYPADGHDAVAHIYTQNARETRNLYKQIKKKEDGFRVYMREEMPPYWHFSKHPYIGNLVLVADLGNIIVKTLDQKRKRESRKPLGMHGYDNFSLDMHGLFVAAGPAFKQGYRTGTVQNVDVYPLICKILNLIPNQKTDGRLERVEAVLKR